jgi:ADP-heptose:LPS heptosyltransferase
MMPKFKFISISREPILFVLTGSKKEVFKNTGALKDFYKYHENIEKIIVTDESNMDIFYNLPNTKIYPMNTETFLILDQMFFGKMILMPNTELSYAFCKKLSKRNGTLTGKIETIKFNDWEYKYIPPSYPIDIVHQKIKRNDKHLIGINIGENEHVTKKLPYSFLCEIMNYVATKKESKFVLFGTESNNVRAEMLRRECHQDMIMMIGNYPTEVFAQAISLCDCFLSLNRFMLHLSLAIEQDTIGLFYNNELEGFKENENMLVNLLPFAIEGKCEICDDNEECECIYNDNHYCFDNLDVHHIGFVISDILRGKS